MPINMSKTKNLIANVRWDILILCALVFLAALIFRLHLHKAPLHETTIHPWHIAPVFGYFTGLGHISGNILVTNYGNSLSISEIKKHKDEIQNHSGPTIQVMWGYSALASLVFWTSGKIDEHRLMLVHFFLDALSAVFIFLIIYHITNIRLAALFGGLLYAFWPTYTLLCARLESSFLLPFFLLSSCYFVLLGLGSRHLRYFFISSFIVGIGLNFTLDILFYLAMSILFIWLYLRFKDNNDKSHRIKSLTIILVIPLIMLAPFILRNYSLYGKFVIGPPFSSLRMLQSIQDFPSIYTNVVPDIEKDTEAMQWAKSLGWKNKSITGKHLIDDLNGIEFNATLSTRLRSIILDHPPKFAYHLLLRFFHIISYNSVFDDSYTPDNLQNRRIHYKHNFFLRLQRLPKWFVSNVKPMRDAGSLNPVFNGKFLKPNERQWQYKKTIKQWPDFIYPKIKLDRLMFLNNFLFGFFLLGIFISFGFKRALIPLSIFFGVVFARTFTSSGYQYDDIKYYYSIFVVYPIYFGILISYFRFPNLFIGRTTIAAKAYASRFWSFMRNFK